MAHSLSPEQVRVITYLGAARFPVKAIAECAECSVGQVYNRLANPDARDRFGPPPLVRPEGAK